MRRGRGVLVATFAALAILTAACTDSDDSSSDDTSNAGDTTDSAAAADATVVFGGFNFTESTILLHVYAEAAEAAGIPATVKDRIGPREAVYEQLFAGQIGVVPEYSGSAVLELGGEATANQDAVHESLVDLMGNEGVAVLDAAPAANHDAIAVTLDTATRLDVRTMSDLAGVADSLVLGAPAECPERPLCIPGLDQTYGITFKSFVPLDPGLTTASSLAQGDIGAGLVFTTDATISVFTLVLLDDDEGLYPAENVTPVVREDVLADFPALADVLDKVSAELTTRDLRALNYTVAITGERPAQAARTWLQDKGLIPSD